MDFEEQKGKRDTLRAKFDELAHIDPEVFARADLGEHSFDQGIPIFRDIRNLSRELAALDLNQVWDRTLGEGVAGAKKLLEALANLKDFAGEEEGIEGRRQRVLNDLVTCWDSYQSIAARLIAPTIKIGFNLSSMEEGLQKKFDKLLGDREKQLAAHTTRYEELNEQIRYELEGLGVARNAKFFEDEATAYKEASHNWMKALLVCGALGIGYVGFLLWGWLPSRPENADPILWVVQQTVVRVILVSAFSFAAAFCARHYSASRHNYVANRHRHNALKSFDTFVKSATEPDVKQAVLLEATRAIFSPQSSGYTKGAAQESQPGGPVIEILRRMSRSESKQ